MKGMIKADMIVATRLTKEQGGHAVLIAHDAATKERAYVIVPPNQASALVMQSLALATADRQATRPAGAPVMQTAESGIAVDVIELIPNAVVPNGWARLKITAGNAQFQIDVPIERLKAIGTQVNLMPKVAKN